MAAPGGRFEGLVGAGYGLLALFGVHEGGIDEEGVDPGFAELADGMAKVVGDAVVDVASAGWVGCDWEFVAFAIEEVVRFASAFAIFAILLARSQAHQDAMARDHQLLRAHDEKAKRHVWEMPCDILDLVDGQFRRKPNACGAEVFKVVDCLAVDDGNMGPYLEVFALAQVTEDTAQLVTKFLLAEKLVRSKQERLLLWDVVFDELFGFAGAEGWSSRRGTGAEGWSSRRGTSAEGCAM